MNAETFICKDLVKPLLWLGRKQGWWSYSILKQPQMDCRIAVPPQDHAITGAEHALLTKLIRNISQTKPVMLFTIHLHTAFLAGGIKCFFPTDEQCEAMLNVQLDIPFAAYRQPFPAMAVRLPASFVARRAAATPTRRFPKNLILEQQPKIITVEASYGPGSDGIFNVIPDRPEYPVLETGLRRRVSVDIESEYNNAELCERLALNFALLLTHYRTRLEERDPEGAANARRLVLSGDRDKRRKGQFRLATLAEEIVFDQEVKVYDREEAPTTQPGGGHHATPRPH